MRRITETIVNKALSANDRDDANGYRRVRKFTIVRHLDVCIAKSQSRRSMRETVTRDVNQQ